MTDPLAPHWKACVVALLLAGCGPNIDDAYPRYAETQPVAAPPVEAPSPELVAELARAERIEAARRATPAVNWMHIGISTGKFSEDLSASVHRTYEECASHAGSEDNECVPIALLPKSYWNAR